MTNEQAAADRIRKTALHLRQCVTDADGNWARVNIDALLDAAEYLERFGALAQPGALEALSDD